MDVKELIDRDERVIGTSMKIRLFPLVSDKSKGSTITDIDGNDYLDFSANWAVANTGYGNPEVVKAVQNQIEQNSFASFTTNITEPSVKLAEKLIKKLPGEFKKKVWFGLSGSDANDCISKLAPLANNRARLISYFGAYHGQTMGSLSLSGHTAQARFIGSGNVTKIPYPYCYRCPFNQKERECNLECLKFLENQVFTSVSPPEDTSAILLEALQCDGGIVPAPDKYLQKLREICNKHGIYLIFDEVKIGVGRTGDFFGFEKSGVVPDAVVFGKPIASGLPLSGVIGRSEILDAGVATHLFTTAGNPVSTAAGLATLNVVEKEQLMNKALELGEFLKNGLIELKNKHEIIGDIRGRGLVQGIELVKDRKTKEPASRETAKISFRAFQNGLIAPYVGIHSNVLEFTPPLVITKEEIKEGIDILDKSIKEVKAGKISEEDLARYAGW